MPENHLESQNPQPQADQLLQSVFADATAPMEHRLPFWAEIRKLLVLNRVGRMVNQTLDLKVILKEVVRLTAETLRVRSCYVFLAEDDRMVLRAAVGQHHRSIGKLRLKIGQGITGWVAENRRPAAVSNTRKQDRIQAVPWPGEQKLPSLLSVPLMMGDSLLGVINVQDDQERTFSYQEVGLLSNLAAHVAGAIRNAQLYEEDTSRLRELQSLQEMGKVISSTLDLPDLLLRVCRLSSESVRADGSIVRLWDFERQTLDVQSSFEAARRIRIRDLYTLESPLARQAFDQQQAVLASEDVVPDSGRRKYATFLCVPVSQGQTRFGVLSLFRIRVIPTAFRPSDMRLIESLTDQACIAIHNARLFTKARQAENALREAQTELFRKQKLAALGNVAAGLAHEIRNPMVSIGGFADRIRRNVSEPQRIVRYAEIIQSEVRRLEQLIGDTLIYAAPQVPARTRVDLRILFKDACALVEQHETASDIRFVRTMAPQCCTVLGDRSLLKRAFLNVLFNAAEIMQGSGKVEIVVRPAAEPKMAAIEVRDEGPGIDPRNLSRIFEPFFSGKEKGTGLGLAIAANIALVHGGSLHAYNRPDGGAAFVFTLPMAGKGGMRRKKPRSSQ